jgi:hypothetical protein
MPDSGWRQVGLIGTSLAADVLLRVRIRGGSALATACARVGATFSPAIRHSIFKDRVATLIRRGAAHPEVRLRYGMFVERHRAPNLDAAIVLIDRMRCAEC